MTNDRITNDDLREFLRNEKLKRQGSEPRQGTTYYHQSLVDLGLENSTGRFASKPIVTGQEPSANVPRQPEGSPWAGDPVGVEPPLNYCIDEMTEPTGTFEEIQKSIAIAEQGEPDADGMVPDQSSLGVDQQRSGSPPSSQRRSVLSTPSASETEKAHLTAEQHRVGTHDLHSVASSNSTKSADLARGQQAKLPLAVGSATVSSPVASQTSPATPSPDDPPDDGLQNVNRRSDGMPLSSHTHAPFKKRKV